MFLKGEISISRRSGGDGSRPICISVQDEDAGTQFLEIYLGLADFAQALTGLSDIPCVLEVRDLNLVGTQIEHKTEFVPSLASPAESLAPFEVDGWKEMSGFENHHCFSIKDGITGYNVVFYRNVSKEATP